jgi:hypothetical protein
MVSVLLRSIGSTLEKMPTSVSGLAKVAIFTTNVDAKNQYLINHKCVCGALNRHFCQTRVTTSAFLSVEVCMSCFAYSHLSFCRAMGHF